MWHFCDRPRGRLRQCGTFVTFNKTLLTCVALLQHFVANWLPGWDFLKELSSSQELLCNVVIVRGSVVIENWNGNFSCLDLAGFSGFLGLLGLCLKSHVFYLFLFVFFIAPAQHFRLRLKMLRNSCNFWITMLKIIFLTILQHAVYKNTSSNL